MIEFFSVKNGADMVKDPTAYSVLTYVWVVVLSAWGGLVRFLNSIKGRKVPMKAREIVFELFLNCTTSVFAGLITFYLCEASNFAPLWTAACVALTGHMGAEGLKLIRTIIRNRLGVADKEPQQ